MTTRKRRTPTLSKAALADGDLANAIRRYVRTYVLWHGLGQATRTFSVSRHTLWCFLERGHTGRALLQAVMDTVGGSVEALEAAREQLIASARAGEAKRLLVANGPATETVALIRPLPQALEDSLLLLCATPLTTVAELARFGRVPSSTLRDRLKKLGELGLVDSFSHRLGVLGAPPPATLPSHQAGYRSWGNGRAGFGNLLTRVPGIPPVVPTVGGTA